MPSKRKCTTNDLVNDYTTSLDSYDKTIKLQLCSPLDWSRQVHTFHPVRKQPTILRLKKYIYLAYNMYIDFFPLVWHGYKPTIWRQANNELYQLKTTISFDSQGARYVYTSIATQNVSNGFSKRSTFAQRGQQCQPATWAFSRENHGVKYSDYWNTFEPKYLPFLIDHDQMI